MDIIVGYDIKDQPLTGQFCLFSHVDQHGNTIAMTKDGITLCWRFHKKVKPENFSDSERKMLRETNILLDTTPDSL